MINDKVSQQLIEDTRELRKNMWQYIRGYNGILNVDPDEGGICVLWYAMHGIKSSEWKLYIESLWQLFVETAESIEGFAWVNEYIGNDGGSDWFVIDLTNTTDEAWTQWMAKFERYYLNDSFMEMIGDTDTYQRLAQQEQDQMLDEFWTEWMPDELYLLPEKYYKDQTFPGMRFNEARLVWKIEDQAAFDAHAQALFVKALNLGDADFDDVGELSITRCVYCNKWDLTDNTKDYAGEYAHVKCHAKHTKKIYPKRLL